MHRRTLLAVAVLALSIAIVTGSGSFTSASAERPVSVQIVEDHSAFLGVDYQENVQVTITNGSETETIELRIQNRFGEAIDVKVRKIRVDGPLTGENVTIPSEANHLQPYDEPTIPLTVTCHEEGTSSISYEILATGSSVRVEMTRKLTVQCTNQSSA
jgi:hypothetical protein